MVWICDSESCASLMTCHLARYWEDPHAFKPSRFLEDWPRDAFLPFAAGEWENYLHGRTINGRAPFHKVHEHV